MTFHASRPTDDVGGPPHSRLPHDHDHDHDPSRRRFRPVDKTGSTDTLTGDQEERVDRPTRGFEGGQSTDKEASREVVRRYMIPAHPPAYPDEDDFAALEKYFGSHVTGSSETLNPLVYERANNRERPTGKGASVTGSTVVDPGGRDLPPRHQRRPHSQTGLEVDGRRTLDVRSGQHHQRVQPDRSDEPLADSHTSDHDPKRHLATSAVFPRGSIAKSYLSPDQLGRLFPRQDGSRPDPHGTTSNDPKRSNDRRHSLPAPFRSPGGKSGGGELVDISSELERIDDVVRAQHQNLSPAGKTRPTTTATKGVKVFPFQFPSSLGDLSLGLGGPGKHRPQGLHQHPGQAADLTRHNLKRRQDSGVDLLSPTYLPSSLSPGVQTGRSQDDSRHRPRQGSEDVRSIAPSESLSQAAAKRQGRRSTADPLQNQDRIVPTATRRSSLKPSTKPGVPEHTHPGANEDMSVLDWVRSGGLTQRAGTIRRTDGESRAAGSGSMISPQRGGSIRRQHIGHSLAEVLAGGDAPVPIRINVRSSGRTGGTNRDSDLGIGADATGGGGDSSEEQTDEAGDFEDQHQTRSYPAAASHAPSQRTRRNTMGAPIDSDSMHQTDQLTQAQGYRSSIVQGWESPAISEFEPETAEVEYMDRMTLGGRSMGGYTAVTVNTERGGIPFSTMSGMRNALETDMEAARNEDDARNRQAQRTSTELSRTRSQLDRLSNEVRKLQARIIAEQVGRNEVERTAAKRSEDARACQSELAAAVRALRRAKQESAKLDEERRKGVRLYEETRERLVKYHEALKVQEARDAGREEGRQEAFEEIERWMTAPPIPVDPVSNIPPQRAQPRPQQQQQQGLSPQQPQEQPQYQQATRPPQPQPIQENSPEIYPPMGGSQRGRQDSGFPPQSSGYPAGPPSRYNVPQSQYPQSGRSQVLPSQGQGSAHPQSSFIPDDQPVPAPPLTRHQDLQNMVRNQGAPSSAPGQGPKLHNRIPQTPSAFGQGDSPLKLGNPSASISPPPGFPRHGAAESFLDRVDQPGFQIMMAGAPARTIGNPSTAAPSRGPTSGSVFSQDKPLPVPSSHHNGRPQAGTRVTGNALSGIMSPGSQQSKKSRRNNPRTDLGLSQSDRYPIFPKHTQEEDTRQNVIPIFDAASHGAFDEPHRIPLPDSRTASEYGTHYGDGNRSGFSRSRPQASQMSGKSSRSRLAAGLRGDQDVSLSMIEEQDERERSTHQEQTSPIMPSRLGAGSHMQDPRTDDGSRQAARAQSMYIPSGEQGQDSSASFGQDEQTGRGGRKAMSSAPAHHYPSDARNVMASPDSAPDFQEPLNLVAIDPTEIPLPMTRPGTILVPEQYAASKHPPPVNVIDYARVPLPPSRPATYMEVPGLGHHRGHGKGATVESVSDMGSGRPLQSILKTHVPLPPGSTVPARRRKTSTFVTIESVPR